MKRTAVYARYSSDNQRAESIEEQVRACRYFAQQTGKYDIVKIYKDEALSGYKNTHKRSGFAQLMSDAEAGLFEAVMVYELSRFARNGSDTIVNTEILERLGIEFVSVRERLDQTPEGRMMMYVITGMNEYYSANLAIEVMRGLKENAYNGKHTGGIPPLGYDVDRSGHYILNPIESAAVRLIFDMYIAGNGYTAIIDELNSRGYKTKRNGNFKKNSLYEIIRNEKYTGTFVYNRTASPGKNGKQNRHAYKSDEDIIKVENAFPAIITKEEYKEAMERMKSQARGKAPSKARRDYMLSGKVYCGNCGRAMSGETRPRRGVDYAYYVCPNHKIHQCESKGIRADKLEETVIKQLNEQYFTPEILDRIANRLHEQSKNGDNDRKAHELRQQSAALKKKIDNGMNAILNGLDIDEMKEAVKELKSQKIKIDNQIIQIEAAADQTDKSVEEIKKSFGDIADISALPYEQQKHIIQKFVWRIYVYTSDNDPDPQIKIVLAPTSEAKEELNEMASDYVALTDFLSGKDGNALPLPLKEPLNGVVTAFRGSLLYCAVLCFVLF